MLKLLQVGLGVAILIVGVSSQAKGYNEQDSQNCRGNLQANPASNVTTAPSESVASSSKGHSVRLSWNASIPASNSPADAIQGYNIYRRDPGKAYEKINTDLIWGTSCVDYRVKAGRTYYYETRAVSANGAVSKSSSEVKVMIPSR
jgi:fibronectin type 3 domain-containing protein